MLFTLPGNPAIYAGDEQGWHGVKHHREGGDVEIRRPFPRMPADLGRDGGPHYRLHQELIQLRRARPFLSDGRIRLCHLASQQLVYEVGSDAGALRTALNLADRPVVLELPGRSAGVPQVVAGHPATVDARAAGLRLTLPPQGFTGLG